MAVVDSHARDFGVEGLRVVDMSAVSLVFLVILLGVCICLLRRLLML